MNGAETRVSVDSIPIGAGALNHYTIAPTRYLAALAVYVIVIEAVFCTP